jgi:hypothetical protein
MWDFVMDKSGAGTGFLPELRFPMPIYIPSASLQSSSLSPEAGTIGQELPQCQYPHKPNKKNNIKVPRLTAIASLRLSKWLPTTANDYHWLSCTIFLLVEK